MNPHEKAPHPTDPNRYADGTVRRNNGLAVTHGGRRQLAIEEARQSELYARWVSDLGGVDRLTAGQEAVLRRAVEANQIADTAAQYLRRTGRRSLTAEPDV